MTDEARRFAQAELENERRLFRDRLLYGETYVDIIGERIDPRTVSPFIAERSAPFKATIDRQEARRD